MTILLQIPTDASTFQGWASLIQVIISAVTGYFLIQTFVLQAKTLKEQQEITKIEQNRFILQFLPSLKVLFSGTISAPAEGLNTDGAAYFNILVSNNHIHVVSINYSGDDRIYCDHFDTDLTLIVPVDGKIPFRCFFCWSDYVPTKWINTFRKNIDITYKDPIGTLYKQTVIFNATGSLDIAIQPAIRL